VYDQRVQIAAIRELERLAGSEAVLLLAERLLDDWGMRANQRTITTLVRLAADGGLLVLTATLPLDVRFYYIKLEALAKGARRLGHPEAEAQVRRLLSQQGKFSDLQRIGRATLVSLARVPLQDIAAGAVIARLVRANADFTKSMSLDPNWLGDVNPANDSEVRDAVVYTEHRVPGLLSVFERGSD